MWRLSVENGSHSPIKKYSVHRQAFKGQPAMRDISSITKSLSYLTIIDKANHPATRSQLQFQLRTLLDQHVVAIFWLALSARTAH